MNAFNTERETIAGKLTAAGALNVTLDPRSPPPCILVDAPSVDRTQGVGGWACTIPVRLLAPAPGNTDALTWLLDQLEVVLGVYPSALPAFPGTVTRNDADLPAYTVPVAVTVPNPNC